MNREPNPYLKNPRLTVTSTMSISVPSMVAEDVLDGPDTITVDPELSGRVDAVSEVVDLMDTRIDSVSASVDLLDTHIDAVSEMSVLFYNECIEEDQSLDNRINQVSSRVDKVSGVLELLRDSSDSNTGDATFTIDKPSQYGVDGADSYKSANNGLTNTGTSQVYYFITTRDRETKSVYPIASLGLICPYTDNTGVYWNPTGQGYDLQFTKDGGNSWTSLTDSGSGSGESNGSWTGIATALATYLNEDGYVSDNASGEFKVLLGSNRRDAASGVVTLYLEDAYGAVTSGVGVLLNASLVAGQGEGDSRYVWGGIRPVISEDNGLYWECRSLEDPNWTPITSPDTLYTTCLYSTGLANADSGTSIDSVGASISYGVDWSNSSDLGYLTIKRESREGSDTRQISLHDLYWLLGNKAKLEELLK